MVQNAAEFTSMKSLMSAPGARTWDTRRLIGFDRAYHRLTGKVAVEKFELGVRVERLYDRAIWELMYLGKARDLKT